MTETKDQIKVRPFTGIATVAGILIASWLFYNGITAMTRGVKKVAKQPTANALVLASPSPSPSKQSTTDPSPQPSLVAVSPVPVRTDNDLKISIHTGIIKETPGYDGWNLRRCPGLDDSCLSIPEVVLREGDQIFLYEQPNGDSVIAKNSNVTWVYVNYSSYNGWVARSSFRLLRR